MRAILHPAIFAVVLFFIPKINLVTITGETAGVRFDDFLLFAVAVCLIGCWFFQTPLKINRLTGVCLIAVGAFFLSNAINASHSSVLYSLRMVEYLVFLWVGMAFAAEGDLQTLVKALLLINCGLILLQSTGLVGAFTAEGYASSVARPCGLANHPAEMAAWLNLMFAALVFGGRVKFWRWSLVVLFCIVLTASRIALFAQCILIFVYVYRNSRHKAVLFLRSFIALALLVSGIVFIPNQLKDRSQDVLSQNNLSMFTAYYDTLPTEAEFTKFPETVDPDNGPSSVDTSWWMRVIKWTQVVKLYVNSTWLAHLVGVGPGTLGPALDGGWLRLLVECGILGTILFVVMLRKIASLSAACAMAVLALSINMTLVDSHIAYKVMAFLFFLAGYTQRRKTIGALHPARDTGPSLSTNSLSPLAGAGVA